jgi:hypothetical protein
MLLIELAKHISCIKTCIFTYLPRNDLSIHSTTIPFTKNKSYIIAPKKPRRIHQQNPLQYQTGPCKASRIRTESQKRLGELRSQRRIFTFLIPIMSRWLASPSAITASTTIFSKSSFSHPQASSLMWLQHTFQATSCLLSSSLQCSLPALTLCSLAIWCCVECMYYVLQMDTIFHIQFCIPQKTLPSRTPQLAAGCTMLRSFMIVAPSLEMVVGVVSLSSS